MTEYPCSITVRPRLGIDLGSNSYALTREYLLSICEFFTLNIEKAGSSAHIQFGGLTKVRPDNIRRRLLQFYPDFDVFEKKNAIKINKHNDFDGLIGYCCKENPPIASKLEKSLEYYNEYYLKVSNPYKNTIAYLTEEDDVSVISPMGRNMFKTDDDYRTYLKQQLWFKKTRNS